MTFLRKPDFRQLTQLNEDEFFSDMANLSKLEGGFFPPPWNMNDHPEKTEGWIEFQKAMKENPKYYCN